MSETRRVLITGVGPISALGVGIESHWNAMQAGRSGLKRLSRFDPAGFACRVAGELSDDAFSVRKCVPKSYRKAIKVMCRDIELAIGAADAAVKDAGLTTVSDDDSPPTIESSRFGCQIGAGLISADVDELTAALVTSRAEDGTFDITRWGENGMQNLTPLWLLKYLPNMLACHVTIIHQLRGPSNTITCCEASSLLSMGESLRVIQRDSADACLTGGAEFKINTMAYVRQEFTGRLASTGDPDDDVAWQHVRPFGTDALGTVLGEGGGLLVLEAEDNAAARGADAYAEVCAISATQSSCLDATGIDYAPDDHSVIDAIEIALDQAQIDHADIDAIVPFGSGIPNSDQAEARAIQTVFGDRSTSIPLITTVPYTGNCNAGNAAIGVAIGAKCLREQALPARLAPDATLEGLDAGPVDARTANLRHVLVLTTSQGGQNSAAILRRLET